MADNSNQDDTTLLDVISDIKRHRRLAFLIIILVMVIYLYLWYDNKELPVVSQSWGTFGDFIGGILNPIFALFAFYWLTSSVRLQVKELQETKNELKKTADAQAKSAEHQESIAKLEQSNVDTQKEILELQKKSLQSQIDANAAQRQQIAIQNFESLFFELLKAKTDVTDNIVYEKFETNDVSLELNLIENVSIPSSKVITLHGKKAIEQCILDFKNDVLDEWVHHYTDNLLGQFGSYFRLNYQILKLIHTNSHLQKLEKVDGKQYSNKQKEYFDIFRATFNQFELEAHFFNCLSSYGNGKFKKLTEIYGLFEPLLIDATFIKNNYRHRLTKSAYRYNPIIFENNYYWKMYFSDLEKLKLVDINIMREDLYILYKENIIEPFENGYFLEAVEDSNKNIPSDLKETLDDIVWDLCSIQFEAYLEDMIEQQIDILQEAINSNINRIQNIKDNPYFSIPEKNTKILENLNNVEKEKKRQEATYKALQNITYVDEIHLLIIYRINFNDFRRCF